MTERQPISKKLRFEVFKRDGFACQYCGAHPSETVMLEVDHIHPVAGGGHNDIDNLVTACFACNRGKGAVPLSIVPKSMADKAAEVSERESQIRAYHEVLQASKDRKDDEIWSVADVLMERFGDESITRSRLASIRMFLERLDYFEVLEAMEIATDKKYSKAGAFSYFCGILLAENQTRQWRRPMSRIRSIHPGIWTDEDFMGLTAHARLLLIGLWTEAWDDGVFEWKPLTLKARIFPVDSVDVVELLSELFEGGFITRAETHPKQPGVIRNFRKFQRPKKPNDSGMLPDNLREFVGLSGTDDTSDDGGSEPVPHQSETSGGKSPQMEDVGCRVEEDNSSSLRSDVDKAIAAYTDMADRTGLPKPRVINEQRRKKIAATLKAHSLDVWMEAVAAIEASDFCQGRTNGWRANLDFLLQSKSFVGLIEGKYANTQPRASPQNRPRTVQDAARDLQMRMNDANESSQDQRRDLPLAIGFSAYGNR